MMTPKLKSCFRFRFYKMSSHIIISLSLLLFLHVLTQSSVFCSSLSSSSSSASSFPPSLPSSLPKNSNYDDIMSKYKTRVYGNRVSNKSAVALPSRKRKTPFTSSEIRIGYLTSMKKRKGAIYITPGKLISGAFTYAVEKINRDPYVLPNHVLRYEIAETYGEEIESLHQTALMIQKGMDAIIGPQETCVHEARLAAAFNVPMISYYCTDPEVSDPILYPTFARTKPTDTQISGSVVSILKMFNWNRVTFIHRRTDDYNTTADTIYDLMLKNDIQVTYRRTYKSPYFHYHQLNPFIRIVSETRHDTRIYVMLGDPYEFVGLMDHLQDLGLLDTGEYFVVGVTRDTYKLDKPLEFLQGIFDVEVTNRTMLAYRHFLSIIHTPPLDPKYKEFKATVDSYLEMPPFNVPNVYKSAKGPRDILPEAVYLYDAVQIYARAVHDILQEGKDPRDGTEVIGRIQGMEYRSAYGYLCKINDKGDAQGNFSVIVTKYIPDQVQKWGMYPVGTFRLDPKGSPIPEFHFHQGESIRWINGDPPLDEPKCGFRYERCIPGETYTLEIAGTVAGGVIFIMIIIAYIFYNNWRYEQELAGLLWKIDYYKDIEFRTHSYSGNANNPNNKSPLKKSASQSSLNSATDVDLRQLFTHVGIYKGTVVAIKRLHKTHVELTQNIKKELKTVRELRHDNINPFIGACVEPMQIAIVTVYCSKGSLQDILENEDIQLDSMFISSLVSDTIKGMIYLHGSEIVSHGRLKSSNCVVDSRWVLKITDYGLHGFIGGGHPPQGEYAHYRNLLCKAPELLRSKNTLPRGSQQGDVYSFAILLFEIQSRNGPYGKCELTPKEIVQRVASVDATGKPFRPRLSEISSTPKFVTDVINQSWDEDPDRRPDFKSLKTMLKPMQKGLKSNIFDNMMAMMEKYASNLESLVQSRTDELIEEKRKTEELLQDMLPGAVADQLMHGKQVEAEGFDHVTIYFSDICGFTVLSAESTPMQIVELLNSLYTLFDSLIDFYDVYKVETIGDAYMVVSGLPKRNGIKHAGEIASMSLNLLQELTAFKIPHRDDKIMLRIGIHTGPVVAGVVGRKMPRYCLFGDTVNVASRMESNGQASKIHISEPTMTLLMDIGGFELQERGYIDIKGKGLMKTYWLTGEDPSRNHQRLQRGIARIERTGSTRRRNKMPDAILRAEGSPQFPHTSNLIKSQSGGNYPLGSPTSRSPNHLHPFSILVGPTSHDLIRRTSSRRRRIQFQINNEAKEASSSGDEKDLGPPEFTADSLPTIIRSKSEKDCCNLDGRSSTDAENSPFTKASSDFSLANYSDTSEGIIPEILEMNEMSRNESPSSNMFNHTIISNAPLFKIESFDGDVLLDSPSCENVENLVHLPDRNEGSEQNSPYAKKKCENSDLVAFGNSVSEKDIYHIKDEDDSGIRIPSEGSIESRTKYNKEYSQLCKTPGVLDRLRQINGISNNDDVNRRITRVHSENGDQDITSSGFRRDTFNSIPTSSNSQPELHATHRSLFNPSHDVELEEVVISHGPFSDHHNSSDSSRPLIGQYRNKVSVSDTSNQSQFNPLRGKGSLVYPFCTEKVGGHGGLYQLERKSSDEINTEGTPLLSDHEQSFVTSHSEEEAFAC